MDVLPSSLGAPSMLARPSLPEPREEEPAISVSFLDAAVPDERAAWLKHWSSWSDRDIMAHPDYARLFGRPQDRVVAAIVRTAAGGILYPLILRPLAQEPWAADCGGVCDATTPYGYGGPYAWGIRPAEAAAFWKQFDAWAAKQQIVTSFARLSLFPDDLLPWSGDVEICGPNIIRRLDLSENEIWADYSYKVRQNVQRARRLGIKVEVDAAGARLDDFLAVYVATMKRRAAAASYFFPRSFFESICSDLREHAVFFHLLLGPKVIASEIVLLSKDYAYSYLGGSSAEAFELRANELLKHESFLWCRDARKRGIILGGGYKGSDGILQYKRSLAPASEVPFKLGRRTYQADQAARLCERRAAWERAQGVEWQPEPGYFPAYRASAVLQPKVQP